MFDGLRSKSPDTVMFDKAGVNIKQLMYADDSSYDVKLIFCSGRQADGAPKNAAYAESLDAIPSMPPNDVKVDKAGINPNDLMLMTAISSSDVDRMI